MKKLIKTVSLVNDLLEVRLKCEQVSNLSKREASNMLKCSARKLAGMININDIVNARSYYIASIKVLDAIAVFHKDNKTALKPISSYHSIERLELADEDSLKAYEFEQEIKAIGFGFGNSQTAKREVKVNDVNHVIELSKIKTSHGISFELKVKINGMTIVNEIDSIFLHGKEICKKAVDVYKETLSKKLDVFEAHDDLERLSIELNDCTNQTGELDLVTRYVVVGKVRHSILLKRTITPFKVNLVEFFYYINDVQTQYITCPPSTPKAIEIIDNFKFIYTQLLEKIDTFSVEGETVTAKIVEPVDGKDTTIDGKVSDFEREIRGLHKSRSTCCRLVVASGKTHTIVIKRVHDYLEHKHCIDDTPITLDVSQIGISDTETLITKVIDNYKTLLEAREERLVNSSTRCEYISKVLVNAANEISVETNTFKLLHFMLSNLPPETQTTLLTDARNRGLI